MDPKELSLLDIYQQLRSESIYSQFKLEPSEFPKFRAEILTLHLNSFLPVLALFGEDARPDDHWPFINFLATRPAGHVLSIQASVVRRNPKAWVQFSKSLRHSGFVFAWLKYSEIVGLLTRRSDVETALGLAFEQPDLSDSRKLDEAESARENLPLPGTAEFLDFLKLAAKRLEAERKRAARGRPTKSPSPYKEILKTRLLAHSLWCRRSLDFAGDYFPQASGDELEKHERAFNKAFSELGLSAVRRPENPNCPDTSE